eukprot:3752139-Pyramimonas_sp.AAC.1
MVPPSAKRYNMQHQLTPLQERRRRREQETDRAIIAFVDEVMQWQADRGRAAFIGIPAQSARWQALPLQATRGRS